MTGPVATAVMAPAVPGRLQLAGVSKVFGRGDQRVVALEGVDLTVEPGEFVAVVGGSGCGKSTMLTLAAGLEEPTSGTVEAAGGVALMFQESTLLPWLTAAKNVELALRLHGVGRDERQERARRLLAKVRLGRHADKRPHELSGGMRQRVALARVLAQEASIVLMDEPLGALDAMTRDQMHDLIEDVWQESGFSVVFVTHNVREAVRLADRAILMGSRPGHIVQELQIELPRPRVMDAAPVAALASELTRRLREEVARHDESDYVDI
ncbi:MAG: ABC transporter ATP-binding protein [Propionicimonas sp.]